MSLNLMYRNNLSRDLAFVRLVVRIYRIAHYLARSSLRPERKPPEPVLEHLEAPGYMLRTNPYRFLAQLRGKSRPSETITLG